MLIGDGLASLEIAGRTGIPRSTIRFPHERTRATKREKGVHRIFAIAL
jgi:hypothetical protein